MMKIIIPHKFYHCLVWAGLALLMVSCSPGSGGPAGGGTLGGVGDGPVATAPGGSDGSVPNGDGGSGSFGPSIGVQSANTPFDPGIVAPVEDHPNHPPSIFGEAKILCKFDEDLVKMELTGMVSYFLGGGTQEPGKFVNYDPGEGMTLRIVDKVRERYTDIEVQGIPEESVQNNADGEGKNQFKAIFTTLFPFPTLEHDKNGVLFYLSPPNHEADQYNQEFPCPETYKYQAVSNQMVAGPPVDTYCHPSSWTRLWAIQPFLSQPLDASSAPPCKVFKENPQKILIQIPTTN